MERSKRAGVERIVVLRRREDGQPQAQVLYARRRRRRRRAQSSDDSWLEGLTRNAVRASAVSANTYLKRHDRSNRRKRDGWLRDLPDNAWTAFYAGKQRFRRWNFW
jgi:hypothetical protein